MQSESGGKVPVNFARRFFNLIKEHGVLEVSMPEGSYFPFEIILNLLNALLNDGISAQEISELLKSATPTSKFTLTLEDKGEKNHGLATVSYKHLLARLRLTDASSVRDLKEAKSDLPLRLFNMCSTPDEKTKSNLWEYFARYLSDAAVEDCLILFHDFHREKMLSMEKIFQLFFKSGDTFACNLLGQEIARRMMKNAFGRYIYLLNCMLDQGITHTRIFIMLRWQVPDFPRVRHSDLVLSHMPLDSVKIYLDLLGRLLTLKIPAEEIYFVAIESDYCRDNEKNRLVRPRALIHEDFYNQFLARVIFQWLQEYGNKQFFPDDFSRNYYQTYVQNYLLGFTNQGDSNRAIAALNQQAHVLRVFLNLSESPEHNPDVLLSRLIQIRDEQIQQKKLDKSPQGVHATLFYPEYKDLQEEKARQEEDSDEDCVEEPESVLRRRMPFKISGY